MENRDFNEANSIAEEMSNKNEHTQTFQEILDELIEENKTYSLAELAKNLPKESEHEDIFAVPYDELTDDEKFTRDQIVFKKKMKRVRMCQTWHYRSDFERGGFYEYMYHCGEIKLCSHCRDKAANDLKASIDTAIYSADGDGEKIWMFETSDDNYESIQRKYGKDKYRRYPSDDGYIFFVQSKDEPMEDALIVTEEGLENIDFAKIVVTPKGKNRSGSLGVDTSKKPKNDNDTKNMSAVAFSTNANKDKVEEIYEEAKGYTRNPDTIDEVEECGNARTLWVMARLQQLGYDVTRQKDKVIKVRISRIKWLNSNINNKKWAEQARLIE